MVTGVDQQQLVPLRLTEGTEERMRLRRARQLLKSRQVRAEAIHGFRLVVLGTGEPPIGHLDAGLHAALPQNSLEDDRTKQLADDPGTAMVEAADRGPQAFANVIEDLRQV